MTKNYLLAITILIGTIIGVGMFAIPLVISKAGIISLFIYFPLLSLIQYRLHLLFAEVILSTKEKHRLPGYVGKYFSQSGKGVAFIIEALGGYGAILAYIIVGGLFLHQLLNPWLGGNLFTYSTILFIFEAIIVFFGLKLIAKTELIFSLFLILAVSLIIWRGWNLLSLTNFQWFNWPAIFLPYGPIFFAVGGGVAIPEVCRLLYFNRNKIKTAIAWGTFIPALVMLIFVLAVVGICGSSTTPDTLSGLGKIMPDGVITFSLLFGLFAIITSFIIIAQAVKEMYIWDLGVKRELAWALACLIPYVLYLAGMTNITKVVSLTGAVAGGLSGMIVIWLLLKVKRRPEQSSPVKNKLTPLAASLLSLIFILGLIYEIWVNFKN